MSDQESDWIESAFSDIRSAERWAAMDQEQLALLLRNGVVAYGITCDESIIPDLGRFYEYCLRVLPEDTRFEVFIAIQSALMAGATSTNALFPVIFSETSAGIASTATIDYAMLHPCAPDDPLSGVRLIAKWVSQSQLGNRAAIFGGLLSLGDRRLEEILASLVGHLTVDQIFEAASTTTGMPTVGAFELWLGWLELCIQAGQGHTNFFAAFASGIVRLVKSARVPQFADVERNFGYAAHKGESAMRILETLNVPDLAQRYAQRLYALEEAEPPPKIMSQVLIEYGLEAKAPVELRGTQH